jgi:hypothetical protein
MLKTELPMWKVAGLILAAWLMFGGARGCDLPDWLPVTTKTAQATWVYEQRDGDPPPYVESALSELNLGDPPVLAEHYDDDLTPPPRLVAVFAAAKAKGLPAFVLSDKDGKVLKVIAGGDFKTKEDVLEAVK